jgi:hypothetical protein
VLPKTKEEEEFMTRPRILFMAILSMVLLLAGVTAALANHSSVNVTVRDANGSAVTNGTTPYSPKQTCTGCHISNCGTGANTWCANETERSTYAAAHPANAFDDYGSGTEFSTHVQGVLDSAGVVNFQAYQNKSFAHGASTGRHSEEGRNENYTNAIRIGNGINNKYGISWGDPFFTSSPGMFGKY